MGNFKRRTAGGGGCWRRGRVCSTLPPSLSRTRTESGDWRTLTTDELFKDQAVVVFSLPGAFTPTCSSTHVPRYNELAPAFFATGVDRIVCVSVNDAFDAVGEE